MQNHHVVRDEFEFDKLGVLLEDFIRRVIVVIVYPLDTVSLPFIKPISMGRPFTVSVLNLLPTDSGVRHEMI